MIDWHSHILPGVDDGSADIEESLSLINSLSSQGVDTVVATPHFYANDESVQSFISRRQKAFDSLVPFLSPDSPDILLGAEVRYYQGISHLEGLRDLRLQNGRILLIEMPMSAWTESMIRELVDITSFGGVRVVLAHIERYLRFQKHGVLSRLLEGGVLMQSNAAFFTSFSTKNKALKLLRNGNIHFIGSDCHNLSSRPPVISKAFEVISNKLGHDFLSQMDSFAHDRLNTRV